MTHERTPPTGDLDVFFELSLDLMCVAGLDGYFKRVNPSFHRVLGWSLEELTERPFLDFVHPDDIEATLAELGNLGEGRLTLHFENRYRCADGSYRWLDWTASPEPDSGLVYATARDVTELRAARRAADEARAAAERADKAKGDFLASMSHEIRTPMNGIIGMTQLTLDTELKPVQREYLGLVQASADALLDIINDILDFSKIEAGKLTFEEIPFTLRQALDSTLKSLSSKAHAKGLELLYREDPDVPPYLSGDPTRLRQVVTNLVANAIKFTRTGEVAVEVEVVRRGDADVLIGFDVRDTGVGIPSDRLEHIFEAFTQADASTTREYGGTGLGLAICQNIVEQLGGSISVTSEMGKGSVFRFEMPFRVRGSDEPRHPARPEELHEMAVLVVDDNESNRLIIESITEGWGMQPIVCERPEGALEVLAERREAGAPVPLVLSDVHMPGTDGFMMVERMRERGDDATVVLLTSAGRQGDGERCRRLGISGYLLKPVSPNELFEAMLLAVGERSARGLSDATRDAALVTRHSLRSAGGSARVLLADDNLVNQRLGAAILERHGFEVAIARNGEEVLELFERETFDAILMDVRMPIMDGLEVTRRIRAREKEAGRGHVPIVALTASALKGDREQCIEAGMDDYVSKPINPTELLESLRRHTGRAKAERAPESAPAQVFDRQATLGQVSGDTRLAGEIVSLVLEEVPERVSQLRRAIDQDRADQLEHAAHQIRGVVAHLRAVRVQDVTRDLEALGRAGDVDGAIRRLQELDDSVSELLGSLRDFLEELSTSAH